MKEFLKNVFDIESNNRDKELLARLCQSSVRVTLILWTVLMFLEYGFLAVALFKPDVYPGQAMRYAVMYGLLIVLAMTNLCIVFMTEKNMRSRYRVYLITCIISAALVILWVLTLTYFDANLFGQVNLNLFMTVMISIPLCSYLSPGAYTLLDVAGCLGFFWIMMNTPEIAGSGRRWIIDNCV